MLWKQIFPPQICQVLLIFSWPCPSWSSMPAAAVHQWPSGSVSVEVMGRVQPWRCAQQRAGDERS